jgi:ornithine decarboxylase
MYDEHIANLADMTPYLVIQRERVLESLSLFQNIFGIERIYYAIKANSEPSLIAALHDNKCNLEVSSIGELEIVSNLHIPASNLISAGTIKTTDFVRAAFDAGVNYFVADSYTEIEKIATHAPGSKLLVRLLVSNQGSEWPLTQKFGVEPEKVIPMLLKAKSVGLLPWGLSFHVGSQCVRLDTWSEAISVVKYVWDLAYEHKISLKSLNIGGGFPIRYKKPIPSVSEIGDVILKEIERKLVNIEELVVEPGRALVGHAGTIVAAVTAKAERNNEEWIYLDIGVFNGLMESLGGIQYPIITKRQTGLHNCILAGPSCDSLDIIEKDASIPKVEVGDRVLILSAGAYTTAYASTFGGAPIPEVFLI